MTLLRPRLRWKNNSIRGVDIRDKDWIILDFKLSPCLEYCKCSFGYLPGVRLWILHIQPLKMELTEGSETSANHNLTPGRYPKEHLQGLD